MASVRGSRRVPLGDFLVGVKKNALAEDELIVAAHVDPSGEPQTFMKIGPRNAMVIAVCSLAVVVDRVRGRDPRLVRLGLAGSRSGRVPARRGGRLPRARGRRPRARSTTSAARPPTAGTRSAFSPAGRSRGARHEDRADRSTESGATPTSGRARASSRRCATGSACPARRTPASRGSAARARCSSTAGSCARASCSRPRPTGTRWSRSKAWPGKAASIPCRTRSPRPGAVQCGFCTPGLVVAAADLLRRNAGADGGRDPRGALGEPLPLHRLPEDPRRGAARRGAMSTPARIPHGRAEIGVRRHDAVPKVTGAFAYSSDLEVAGMLWGHTVRSPHAHARVLSVDVSEAVRVPGVHAVLTHEDVPGQKTYGLEFQDQPVLAERPRALLRRAGRGRGRGGARAGAPSRRGRPRRVRRARADHGSRARDRVRAAASRPSDDGPRLPRRPAAERRALDRHPARRSRRRGRRRRDRGLRGRPAGPGVPRPGVRASRSRTGRAASTSTSRPSGSTSTATRSRRASTFPPTWCGSTSPAWAARSAGARTCPSRSTPRCSRCARTAR